MGLLEGRTALVTGAGRGIGTAVARLFAAEGAKVIVHYYTSLNDAELLAAEIGGAAFGADLRDPVEAQNLARDAASHFGSIDILVNTAASFTHGKPFMNDSWSSYLYEINGVLGVTFHITQAALPYMKAKSYGRIVNFGATLLHRPIANYGPHITAKSAVVGFTSALAREVGAYGITVNMIHPGMTLTDYSNALPQSQRDAVAERTPMRRLAEPDDVARAALFFASDLSRFVTGAQLASDGGLATL